MKEMKYIESRGFYVLAHGTYKNIPYWVISYGTHPCAYIDTTSLKKSDEEVANIDCHGGVTYTEDRLHNIWDEAFDDFEPHTRQFVGWDYAHSGDYIQYPNGIRRLPELHENEKKWTTVEIRDEIFAAIDDILK